MRSPSLTKRFAVGALLSAVAGGAAAEDGFEIQARLGVVHYNGSDIKSYFEYIAAVPVHIFHYDGKCYESPLVLDTTGAWVDYFHADAVTYFNQVGGLRQIVAVGDVSDATLNDLCAKYGLGSGAVVRVKGATPVETAEKLARDWTHAENAVLVPYTNSPGANEFESAANGAALASRFNAPLLFVEQNNVPEATLRALAQARVKNIYLVEFGDYCGSVVNGQLEERGYTIVKDFIALPEFVPYMRSQTGHSALVTFKDGWQSLPGAAAASRHGAYCAFLPQLASELTSETASLLASLTMPTEKFHVGEWNLPEEYDSGEQGIADAFLAWLDGIGGTDPTQMEWVTYFGPKSGPNGTYVNFDRAIIGNPLDPDKPGCKPGRFPGDVAQNVFFANRDLLYRAIIFGNPHPGRAITAYNAFVCHYEEQGYTFTDNYGNGRCVNEIFGVPAFNEIGVAERFWNYAYETCFDSGYYAGTYQGNNWHPINPPGHTLDGFLKYLNDGSCFFYYSGHGSTGSIAAMADDMGCNEKVPWGMLHWPAPAGIITDAPGSLPLTTWDSALQNIHGTVITFDACLVGAGDWNESGFRHGGGGGISSYVSVSWEGSGWFWCITADQLTAAKPAGEAVAFATGQTSHIYPQHDNGADGTLMYYWAGDPFMVLYQPAWTRPTPAPLFYDYGGHNPGGFVDIKLVYFRARAEGDGARVEWAACEGACAGYNLYRETGALANRAGGDGKIRINERLIVGRSPFSYFDTRVASDRDVRYWLETVDANGESTVFGPATLQRDGRPQAFALRQNYPNPASSATTIEYEIPAAVPGAVGFSFYDLAGRCVARHDLGTPAAGKYKFVWDGANEKGERLAAGVYIYRLTEGNRAVATRRLVLTGP